MIPGNETVTIERKAFGEPDRFGNETVSVMRIPVEGCLIAWGGTSTSYELDRTLITSAAVAYMPAGTQVEDNDEFIVRGKKYLKDGEAQYWTAPPTFSVTTGVVVALKRAEG